MIAWGVKAPRVMRREKALPEVNPEDVLAPSKPHDNNYQGDFDARVHRRSHLAACRRARRLHRVGGRIDAGGGAGAHVGHAGLRSPARVDAATAVRMNSDLVLWFYLGR